VLFSRRGTARRAPTILGDDQYSMEVIRHDDVLIQPDVGPQQGRSLPFFLDHISERAQNNIPGFNLVKETFSARSANGDKVFPGI
jgi:hypothetical protein